ncbi:MAG: hypothetical protein ACE5FG_06815 [Myxococcota bacterium]
MMGPLALLLPLAAGQAPTWLSERPPARPTALVERGRRIVLGTERGLYGQVPEGWRLIPGAVGIRGLCESARGTLIATEAGLLEWPLGAAEPQSVPLAAGARVNAVTVDAEGVAWVATDVGLFRRGVGQTAFQRDAHLPLGGVRAVRARGRELWVSMQRAIWQRDLSGRFSLRVRSLEAGWWELRDVVAAEEETLLAVPAGLWRVPPKGGSRSPERISLPLGTLHALARADHTLFVAAERGVYRLALDALGASHERTDLVGAGLALAPSSRGLLVATRRGVALLAEPPNGGRLSGLEALPRGGPEVRQVQRAVLAYLELSPNRLHAVEMRARRAALYPELRAGLSLERGRSRDRERDQTFSSGDVRDLLDRGAARETEHRIEIKLVWDLSRIATPDDALAISRERRQLIELRDQVLEQVNRLYFERLRVLERWAALPADASEERRAAALRARELAARLDAWSGGMFSRLARTSAPPLGRTR